MDSERLDQILKLIAEFAGSNDEILAIGLCGSWARGSAGSNSDFDLSIIVEDKLRFKNTDWVETIDFKKINDELDYYLDKIYGRVWSRHIFLKSKTEIEWVDLERTSTTVDTIGFTTHESRQEIELSRQVSSGPEYSFDRSDINSKPFLTEYTYIG